MSLPELSGNFPTKFTVHSNLVFLPTRVQSKKGETIYGLKPEDFIVEDNGVRQSVQVDEDPDSSGLSLVVAVQCSRSAPLEFSKLKGLGSMIDQITGEAPRRSRWKATARAHTCWPISNRQPRIFSPTGREGYRGRLRREAPAWRFRDAE